MPSVRAAAQLGWIVLLCACVLPYTATAVPLENITLPLPVGTSNHGTPGLLCTPTQWTDIVLFFLFNYIAHAATVLTRPGERSVDSVVSVFGCLLLPVLGLYRGIEAIFSGAVFVKNDDLRKAARSGALCMVVRGRDWRPVDGDAVQNAVFRRKGPTPNVIPTPADDNLTTWDSTATAANDGSVHVVVYSAPWICSKFGTPVYVSRQIVHGISRLPEGYLLAIVPPDAQFTIPSKHTATVEISASYNAVKALLALVQAGYALATLYRSQGDQVQQFGFSAFGLTVAPYAIMSVINLLGNICQPDYASLYMVESSTMDEARKRGAIFGGFVGRLKEDDTTVCGCGLSECCDVEQLHFSTNENGGIAAEFMTASSPHAVQADRASPTTEKCASASSASLTPQTCLVQPVPQKLNYANTRDDSLLLVPCCNPIQRSPTNSLITDEPARYQIAKLDLRKTNPACKPRTWYLCFTPTPATALALRWYLAKYLLTTIIAFSPIAITGAISHFSRGTIPAKESSTWRSYVMQWLIWGVFSGILWVFDHEWKDASPVTQQQFRPVARSVLYLVSGSSAVGVFVVVGQMLSRYGVCVWVGN